MARESNPAIVISYRRATDQVATPLPHVRYEGFEPPRSAWKADMLAVKHQYPITDRSKGVAPLGVTFKSAYHHYGTLIKRPVRVKCRASAPCVKDQRMQSPARWNRTTLGSGLQPRRIPDVSGHTSFNLSRGRIRTTNLPHCHTGALPLSYTVDTLVLSHHRPEGH